MSKKRTKHTPQLRSIQCKDTTLKQQRCKNRTRRTKHCWIHLLKNKNLRIKKSLIPNAGLGLFVGKKRVKRRTSLGLYMGRRIINKKLDKYYPKTNLAPYAICKSGKPDAQCINANYSMDAAPRYANDIKSLKKTNMDIRNVGKRKYVPKAFATKSINPGKEIYYFYGKQYWK